jgi:hypothetical protein
MLLGSVEKENVIYYSHSRRTEGELGVGARVNGHPHCPHGKNPEIDNLYNFRILTSNLVSKVLY